MLAMQNENSLLCFNIDIKYITYFTTYVISYLPGFKLYIY